MGLETMPEAEAMRSAEMPRYCSRQNRWKASTHDLVWLSVQDDSEVESPATPYTPWLSVQSWQVLLDLRPLATVPVHTKSATNFPCSVVPMGANAVVVRFALLLKTFSPVKRYQG